MIRPDHLFCWNLRLCRAVNHALTGSTSNLILTAALSTLFSSLRHLHPLSLSHHIFLETWIIWTLSHNHSESVFPLWRGGCLIIWVWNSLFSWFFNCSQGWSQPGFLFNEDATCTQVDAPQNGVNFLIFFLNFFILRGFDFWWCIFTTWKHKWAAGIIWIRVCESNLDIIILFTSITLLSISAHWEKYSLFFWNELHFIRLIIWNELNFYFCLD